MKEKEVEEKRRRKLIKVNKKIRKWKNMNKSESSNTYCKVYEIKKTYT
jgi:hypothetical protein